MERKIFRQLLPFAFFLPSAVKAEILASISKVLLSSALLFNVGNSQTCFQDRTELKNAVDDYIYSPSPIPCPYTSPTSAPIEFINVVDAYGCIEDWCVVRITDMSRMFHLARAFNEDLSSWNVSSVTSMYRMFSGADSFNQDLSSWDVGKVTDMSYMFSGAYVFNQDLSRWDVSKVTDMPWMLSGAYVFNQDLSNWDVRRVIDMSWMFFDARLFNQNLSSWDVGRVIDMSYMFYGAASFNQDLSSWDVSGVTAMSYMFYRASAFNQNLCPWREKVNQNSTIKEMFFNSSCPTTDDPDLTGDPADSFCFFCLLSTSSPVYSPTLSPTTPTRSPIPNFPPYVIARIPSQEAKVGRDFVYTIEVEKYFEDPEGDPIMLEVSQEKHSALALPDWLSFENDTFKGIPTKSDIGSYLIRITVTDPQKYSTSQLLSIDVLDDHEEDIVEKSEDKDLSATDAAKIFWAIGGALVLFLLVAFVIKKRNDRQEKIKHLLLDGEVFRARMAQKGPYCNCFLGISDTGFKKIQDIVEEVELTASYLLISGERLSTIKNDTIIPSQRLNRWKEYWDNYPKDKKDLDEEDALAYLKEKETSLEEGIAIEKTTRDVQVASSSQQVEMSLAMNTATQINNEKDNSDEDDQEKEVLLTTTTQTKNPEVLKKK